MEPSSFFEIAGHVVECMSAIETSAREHNLSVQDIYTPNDLEIVVGVGSVIAEKIFLPEESKAIKAAKLLQKAGRLKRAGRAAKIAGALAISDGPLPFGEMLAVGVLTGYATYEVYRVVFD